MDVILVSNHQSFLNLSPSCHSFPERQSLRTFEKVKAKAKAKAKAKVKVEVKVKGIPMEIVTYRPFLFSGPFFRCSFKLMANKRGFLDRHFVRCYRKRDIIEAGINVDENRIRDTREEDSKKMKFVTLKGEEGEGGEGLIRHKKINKQTFAKHYRNSVSTKKLQQNSMQTLTFYKHGNPLYPLYFEEEGEDGYGGWSQSVALDQRMTVIPPAVSEMVSGMILALGLLAVSFSGSPNRGRGSLWLTPQPLACLSASTNFEDWGGYSRKPQTEEETIVKSQETEINNNNNSSEEEVCLIDSKEKKTTPLLLSERDTREEEYPYLTERQGEGGKAGKVQARPLAVTGRRFGRRAPSRAMAQMRQTASVGKVWMEVPIGTKDGENMGESGFLEGSCVVKDGDFGLSSSSSPSTRYSAKVKAKGKMDNQEQEWSNESIPGQNVRKDFGKDVVVPSLVDPVQAHALEALQKLKVVEKTIDPAGICKKREFARWVLAASNVLSRSTSNRVLPAIFVEGLTELAFDDVLPQDPDFAAIQGLAEAGLISSRLTRSDLGCNKDVLKTGCSLGSENSFRPDSPLTRQDLICWKMALEHRNLPYADAETVQEMSGFIDVDRIDRDALPAVAYDLCAGDKCIISTAFGYTRRFEPKKAVNHAQAACCLALGSTADVVTEELERLQADKVAEAEAEILEAATKVKEVDAANVKAAYERQRREEAEKAAEAAKKELKKARIARKREEEMVSETQAAVETERELLMRVKQRAEEQLVALSTTKQEVEAEKLRLENLTSRAEAEKQATEEARTAVQLEKEAFAMARSQAEQQAEKAREEVRQLKALRKKLNSDQANSSPKGAERRRRKTGSPKVIEKPGKTALQRNPSDRGQTENSVGTLDRVAETAGILVRRLKTGR